MRRRSLGRSRMVEVPVKLDETFEKLIDHLVEHEKTVAEAVQQSGDPKPWMNFSGEDLETKAEDKEESSLHDVFDREKVNESYVDARSKDDSKANEIAVPKLAGDFMAALERDKREQWRDRIRTMAHAAARRAGDGQNSGPLRRHTIDFLSRIFLKAEEKKPNG